ncbi:uncharacterized protein FOMMEDRAFT_24673 [Fomitiporia mediterranea MF3/22]|uniref:uncharacterized protein n=1 Tax=Fomitiporia mediterranea (strain MF3/22) TaxID=694068 RepID=UPI0004409590|nr:uncharacterized protein FOMMEDRAFT_24673 [Fomitiporia mediterranea MF3/22]EJD07248.1 hypothetical protein FOMMEDRAFT_24673 [Fomitiporia mediterranea MF3/22]
MRVVTGEELHAGSSRQRVVVGVKKFNQTIKWVASGKSEKYVRPSIVAKYPKMQKAIKDSQLTLPRKREKRDVQLKNTKYRNKNNAHEKQKMESKAVASGHYRTPTPTSSSSMIDVNLTAFLGTPKSASLLFKLVTEAIGDFAPLPRNLSNLDLPPPPPESAREIRLNGERGVEGIDDALAETLADGDVDRLASFFLSDDRRGVATRVEDDAVAGREGGGERDARPRDRDEVYETYVGPSLFERWRAVVNFVLARTNSAHGSESEDRTLGAGTRAVAITVARPGATSWYYVNGRTGRKFVGGEFHVMHAQTLDVLLRMQGTMGEHGGRAG